MQKNENEPDKDMMSLMNKFPNAKLKIGTFEQVISGAFLGVSFAFLLATSQIKNSSSSFIALTLFSICIPLFAAQFLLSSFDIELTPSEAKPFNTLRLLFFLNFLCFFLAIFFFLHHIFHLASYLFVFSPFWILLYVYLRGLLTRLSLLARLKGMIKALSGKRKKREQP